MSNLIKVQGQSEVATIQIDPSTTNSLRLTSQSSSLDFFDSDKKYHKKLAHFVAIKQYIRKNNSKSNNSLWERTTVCIEILHHLCELKDWLSINTILEMPIEIKHEFSLPFYEYLEFAGRAKTLLEISEEIIQAFSDSSIDLNFIHILRARAFQSMSEYYKAQETLKMICVASLEFTSDRYFEANALLGIYQIRTGMFKEGSKRVEECLKISEDLLVSDSTDSSTIKNLKLTALLLSSLAWRDMVLTKYKNALNLYSQALKISRECNHAVMEISVLAHQGIIYRKMCTPLTYTLNYLTNSRFYRIFRILRFDRIFKIKKIESLSHHLQENYKHAHDCLMQAKLKAERLEDKSLISFLLDHLGWVALNRGEPDLAEEYCRLAMKGYQERDEKVSLAHSWQQLGRIYLAKGRHYTNLAEPLFRDTLKSRQERGDLAGIPSCFADLAVVSWHKRKYVQFIKCLLTSIYWYWKMGRINITQFARILTFFYVWNLGKRDWTP